MYIFSSEWSKRICSVGSKHVSSSLASQPWLKILSVLSWLRKYADYSVWSALCKGAFIPRKTRRKVRERRRTYKWTGKLRVDVDKVVYEGINILMVWEMLQQAALKTIQNKASETDLHLNVLKARFQWLLVLVKIKPTESEVELSIPVMWLCRFMI